MNKILAKAGCYNGYTAFKFIKRCLWRKEKKSFQKNKKRRKSCVHFRPREITKDAKREKYFVNFRIYIVRIFIIYHFIDK